MWCSPGSGGRVMRRIPICSPSAAATAWASSAMDFADPLVQVRSGERLWFQYTKNDVPNDALFMHEPAGSCARGPVERKSPNSLAASETGTVARARPAADTYSAAPLAVTTIRYPVVFVEPVSMMTAEPGGTGR